jgi:hypothetical protein
LLRSARRAAAAQPRLGPGGAQAARDVVVSHYKLGMLKLRVDEIDSAIAHFGKGIEALDAMIAKGLNTEEAERQKAILVDLVRTCHQKSLATGDWEALLKSEPSRLPMLLSLRATEMARRGQLAEVAQAGAKLRELEPKTGDNLYNAACAYGLCAGLVVKDKSNPTPAEAAKRQKYLGIALDCLREALGAGFKDFAHMRDDTELAALRGLPEFERLFPKGDSQ